MQSRCCCPPESPPAGASRRSFTSFHNPAFASAFSTSSARSPRDILTRLNLGPERMFSAIDLVGKGFGRWKTIPIARRMAIGFASVEYRLFGYSRG